jgi:hypothetical protein
MFLKRRQNTSNFYKSKLIKNNNKNSEMHLANLIKFRQTYKQNYLLINYLQYQDAVVNIFSNLKEDAYHYRSHAPVKQRKKLPWLQPLTSKRVLYQLQYFNLDLSLRSP